jgi:hypothetical protein
MSSDPPPRRASRLSNKRTVVPDDGTEGVVMTVTKRRGKRTDAGRRHTMTCTFVIDVLRILYDTVTLRHNIRKNSAQCMRVVVCSADMRCFCVKYIQGTACTLSRAGLGMQACLSYTGAARYTILEGMWLQMYLFRY